MFALTRSTLTKVRLLHLLEELKASSVETGSLCVPPGYSREMIEALLKAALGTPVPAELAGLLLTSPTGGIIFFGPHQWYLVMPPFPIADERFSKTCEIEPLHTLLHRDFLLGIIIVRLGEYSIGVYKGEKLLVGKKGTGLIHSRHRQGGSSSHRFEHRREKQMETFFTRVCEHSREIMEPYTGQVEYMLYGGTKETITDFRKQCGFLHSFDHKTLPRLLNIRDPKHSGLDDGIEAAWSSDVVRWDAR